MKSTDFIRGLLDLIDAADETADEPVANDYEDEVIIIPPQEECSPQFSNSPDEIYATLELIDTMGNDLNSIKKPEDVKSATFPMFFGMNNG